MNLPASRPSVAGSANANDQPWPDDHQQILLHRLGLTTAVPAIPRHGNAPVSRLQPSTCGGRFLVGDGRLAPYFRGVLSNVTVPHVAGNSAEDPGRSTTAASLCPAQWAARVRTVPPLSLIHI